MCQRKLVCSSKSNSSRVEQGGRHCETLLKHTTFRQQRKPADILESLCFSKTRRKQAALAHRILNQSKEGLGQGARELNYLLPLEWADVIIIISPGLRWRAAGAGRISADMWVQWWCRPCRASHITSNTEEEGTSPTIIGAWEHCRALREVDRRSECARVHKQGRGCVQEHKGTHPQHTCTPKQQSAGGSNLLSHVRLK